MQDSKATYRIVELDTALQYENVQFVDVRSPSEYLSGRLPGAINIPVFNDEERAAVGTLYKQSGREAALKYGLLLFSAKLPDYIERFKLLPRDRRIVVYCWRGGMRSRAAVTMAGLADIRCEQLFGGYKQYRAHILQRLGSMELKPEIVVLCGSTGAGKTELLADLKQQGLPVIDLEKIANHRGSAFGGVGLGRLQTAHNFDALLLTELERYVNEPYIIVECESKRIGNVYLPDCLFRKMAAGKKILLQTMIEKRAARLVREYTEVSGCEFHELEDSLKLLEKKLGRNTYSKLCAQLQGKQYEEFTMLLLEKYYDPLYGYETAAPEKYDCVVCGDDTVYAEKIIMNRLGEWYER